MSAAAQPLVVVTEWGARGAEFLGLLLLALGVAALLYRYVLARSRPPPLAATTAIAAAGLLAALLSPVLFSSDVYAYAAYGELARLGADPYAPAAPSLANERADQRGRVAMERNAADMRLRARFCRAR